MSQEKESNTELERFISDWHWDEKSHVYAIDIGNYLFQFLDKIEEEGLSEKTIRNHTDNCWHIGILECNYGYNDKFDPGNVFFSPEASFEYEFQRKVSDSNYAVSSYRSTWRKIYKYTKALGHTT